MRPTPLLLGLLCLGFVTQTAQAAQPTPLMAWGPSEALPFQGTDEQAVTTENVLGELLGAEPTIAPRPATLLFVSPASLESLDASVKAAQAGAEARMALPSALSVDPATLLPGLLAGARAAGRGVTLLGACPGMPTGPTPTQTALQAALGGELAADTLTVVCSQSSGAAAAALLGQASAQVAAANPLVVALSMPAAAATTVMYVGAQPMLGWSKHDAQNHTENYTVCDPICQRHVMFFEGLIILFVAGLAVWVGLTCLHMINTPTRLPVNKAAAGGSHHHD